MKADVNSAFRHAYKFLAFLLTPLHPPHDKSRFRTGAAGPLGRILYEAAYASSVPHLQLQVFASHSIAFGYLVHTAFFNGFGRTRVTFVLHLVASGALFLSAPVLAETFGQGVDVLIYAIFLSYFVAWAIGTVVAFRFLHATLDIQSTFKILLVSGVSYVALLSLPALSLGVALVADVLVFFGLYLTWTPPVRGMISNDLDLIEVTLGEPALVRKVTSPIIRYERFLAKQVHRKLRARVSP